MRILFFTIIFSFSIFLPASAAQLSVASDSQVSKGEQFFVDIVADTDRKEINSIKASVLYEENVLKFVGYQDGAGLVKLWVEPPHIESKGQISFVGGVPGGVSGLYVEGTKTTDFNIVRLIFLPKEVGSTTIKISESLMLLNDGDATALVHNRFEKNITIISQGDEKDIKTDLTPPMPFNIIFIPQNKEGNTPAMISFTAFDEDSGISNYKVKIGLGQWKDATSPYRVPKRIISYTVKVSAFDGYGNETTSLIKIKGLFPTGAFWVTLGLILASIYRFFMVKKKI